MIQDDSHVLMHVTIRVEGEVVHSTTEESPLDYVLGSGGLVPGLESALVGMQVGEKKNASVAPQEAFGMRDPDAIHRVPKSSFADTESLAVGDAVRGTAQDQPFTAYIQAIDATEVTLDLNHPLAGKTVDFEVEILEIK